MNIYELYMDVVYPHFKDTFTTKYPHITLQPGGLAQTPVLMLVALTGTGKSTTLDALKQQGIDYADNIPSRREIADIIVIPTAQTLLNETIEPVKDRTRRFFYTRTFAQQVSGGVAEAFSWLHLETDKPIVSEGIRGEQEISYALAHCPGWHILELSVSPIIRLKRLSSRESSFDRAVGSDEIDFLPEDLREEALNALRNGDITPEALTIMRAEAENYGLLPYNISHSHYTCLQADDLSPQEIALHAANLLKAMTNHA